MPEVVNAKAQLVTQRKFEDLSKGTCFELIRQQITGRFVFLDQDGPGAVPVNYALAGELIVFRTAAGTHLRDVLRSPVAFEIDSLDAAEGRGWSVLVRGDAQEVEFDSVPGIISLMDDLPRPWGEGVHNVWIAITARKVTGRRLQAPYFAAIF